MVIPEEFDIRKFLPHRAPMLMVDELVTLDVRSASCRFHVTDSCLFVKDGELSGAGLIEHAAQTSTAVVGRRFFPEAKAGVPVLLGFISAVKNIEMAPCRGLVRRSSHVPRW
ncbi:MAG: hypothetical protein IPI95_00925 [Flavobacteriales bacterium]|nr:hypothetical protein [Flavobacteriales bacterium]